MSKDSKFLTRPKVRFSQNPVDEEKPEGSKASAKQSAGKQSGPKIRSVVILDKPVTLIREGKPPDYFRYKQPAHVNSTEVQGQEEDEIQCLTARFAAIPNITVHSATPQTRDSGNGQIPMNPTKNARNVNITDTNNHATNVLESDDSSDIKEVPIVPPLDLPASDDEKQIRKQKPKAAKHTNNSKNHRGKENSKSLANSTKPVNVPKKKPPTAPRSINPQKTKATTADFIKKTNSAVTNSKKPLKECASSISTKENIKALPKKQAASAGRSNPTIKPVVTLMPCHKYAMQSKTKSSSVTKKVLYNITGPKLKPYVGPGVLKSIDKVNPIPGKARKSSSKENDFSERLFRPEYNSIMCTVNKLEEVRDEKIVTDIDNLPSSYKALINSKASTALDFPMNSAIYKNLVDLSVDEQQLPSRLTRSKDPEPREKDVTPVLSDFFAPETTEEYCIPVSVQPCTPDVIDNWSAYKISDKIVYWKASMDAVQ